MTRSFAVDVTNEEAEFGFAVTGAPSGSRSVVVARLAPGLRAVKVRGHGGETKYLVCNERLAPLYAAAKSLEELRSRFLVR
jgi:hypothetical protein